MTEAFPETAVFPALIPNTRVDLGLILAIQNAVDARDIGVATGTSMFMRQLGGAVGLALLGSIFNSRLKHWIPRLTPSDAHLNLARLRGRPETLAHLTPGTRMGVIDAFARSLHSVFLWSIPIAIIAFVLALFLREIPLKEHLEGPGDDETACGEVERRRRAGDPVVRLDVAISDVVDGGHFAGDIGRHAPGEPDGGHGEAAEEVNG